MYFIGQQLPCISDDFEKCHFETTFTFFLSVSGKSLEILEKISRFPSRSHEERQIRWHGTFRAIKANFVKYYGNLDNDFVQIYIVCLKNTVLICEQVLYRYSDNNFRSVIILNLHPAAIISLR
jgi:hypothetical protein